MQKLGISSIGLAIPQYGLPLTEFAKIYGVKPEQYTENLGCKVMSLCGPNENVVTLAIQAAQRAVNNWNGDKTDIGLVIAATETGIDMSRPLSSWVMNELGLSGNIRSYEVKHACYGGTAAVRQALEWKISGNSKGKAALVIAADVAMYAPGHSGEPTQGAGAVAMIIDTATIATINPTSYYWSEPNFDFWRPVGQAYPQVNGRLSLTCYIDAVVACFEQLATGEQLSQQLNSYDLLCMHVPFPKMVQKAFKHLGDCCGWDADTIQLQYQNKVLPAMQWNQQIGNSYTASLWFAVANALTKLEAGQNFLAFSYGSGCGAELLTLQALQTNSAYTWQVQLEQDLANRTIVDADFYRKIRNI